MGVYWVTCSLQDPVPSRDGSVTLLLGFYKDKLWSKDSLLQLFSTWAVDVDLNLTAGMQHDRK